MDINQVVSKRVERIEECVRRLREGKKVSKEKFFSDWQIHDAVLRNFQVAIESCLDVGSHIIAISGWKSPEGYKNIAEILSEKGVIPKDFEPTAKDMAEFRNVIVHDYLYIDLEKVYANLQKLDNIQQFVKYMVDFVRRR